MFTSMSLTLLGILFITTIAVFYFQKKKYNDLRNNIYRFLLILTIVLSLLELCCVYTMSIRDRIPIINEILCRGYILGTIVWLINLVAYINTILHSDKYSSTIDLFTDNKMVGYIVISVFFFCISCFLDIKYSSGANNQYYVIGGPGVSILYIIYGAVGLFLVRSLLYKLNKSNIVQRIPIIMFISLYFVFSILQLIYVDFNELTFLFIFCIIAIYFTLESQDLRLVAELDSAKKEAELADKAKTQFLTKISHEIRTPMNVIMGYSELLLKKQKLNEHEVTTDVKNVYKAGKSLLEIINNILTYSRIESGKEKIEENEYSISDIIGELESFVYAKIDPEKINFSIVLDGDIPSNYIGDKLKIYRVLLNLINNSIKYTEEGDIKLTIKCDVFTENLAQLKFEVKDTGTGMKKEDLENIYDQLNKVNTKNYDISGIGLGLILSKKIIDMLDGSITCESENGIGTTFTVNINQKTLGNTKIKDLQHLKDKIGEKNDTYFDCCNYKILIVDDNKLNRLVIERLLKPYKINYESLDKSIDCINKIKSGEKYDLILLDHMMPDIDGIETLRILKKMNIKNLPPVIAVTANLVTELKETYIKEGFSDYLAKPVNIKDLQRLMNKYFKKENER